MKGASRTSRRHPAAPARRWKAVLERDDPTRRGRTPPQGPRGSGRSPTAAPCGAADIARRHAGGEPQRFRVPPRYRRRPAVSGTGRRGRRRRRARRALSTGGSPERDAAGVTPSTTPAATRSGSFPLQAVTRIGGLRDCGGDRRSDPRIERGRHDPLRRQDVAHDVTERVAAASFIPSVIAQRAASNAPRENAGERQHVVDLIRVVAAARGDDRAAGARPPPPPRGPGWRARK